ncbi:hypothetical protein B9G69_011760 [Bdellovibrio sp. SKB1291214]|uniref:hypothetical protein n=1 Tax=Bdellovibrio sp. SKB1291214 TaxID=1732569 RepID=UPI001C3C25AB|nr:hypothetical protein [Bdellovibrio sp. SKB1291214]UYL07722.1 hypothetical protein B9G69_011760 [Bdellovibrio sp. SKB1291214]
MKWTATIVFSLLCAFSVPMVAQAQIISCLKISSQEMVAEKASLKNVVSSCQEQMKKARCDQWFKVHPQALEKARSCDPIKICSSPGKIKDYAASCSAGVWNSSVDLVKGAIDFVVGSSNISPETKAREDFFKACTTAECKLQMLGPYADLFTPEEIVGSPNTKGLNSQDVVNQVYLNGYSAKTLYRKLQEKLRERAKGKNSADVFIEPWSGNPALPKRSVDQLIEEMMTAAGIENTTCFDPEVVWEARCYALATVLDPLAASVSLLRMKKIAALMKMSDERTMVRSAIKDDYIRSKVMKSSSIDAEKLKAVMNPIWADPKLSYEQKSQALFDKYYEFRSSAMEKEVKELADKVIADIQPMKGSEAYYNIYTQKMSVGLELAADPLSRVMTIAHELEHVAQYPYKTGLIRQFANALEQKLKKLERPHGVTSRLQAEFEAMSAQWDIIQSVPLDVRKKAIESIRANKKLSNQAKSSAIADIEKASLSREEYLKSVAGLHGYTSYNSLRTKSTLIVSALLVQMSVVGAEEVKTQWQSRN